jgi:hypothetical protein
VGVGGGGLGAAGGADDSSSSDEEASSQLSTTGFFLILEAGGLERLKDAMVSVRSEPLAFSFLSAGREWEGEGRCLFLKRAKSPTCSSCRVEWRMGGMRSRGSG